MQSCQLITPESNYIYYIWCEENTPQMDKLIEMCKTRKKEYSDAYLIEKHDYIQIKMELFSGDVLLIICESLECTEEIL